MNEFIDVSLRCSVELILVEFKYVSLSVVEIISFVFEFSAFSEIYSISEILVSFNCTSDELSFELIFVES